MAWTDITDEQLEPESPVSAVTLTALRDNVPAIANGDAGAPKIQNDAISDKSLGRVVILTDGLNGSGTYSLPSSYEWADFRRLLVAVSTAVITDPIYTSEVPRQYFIDAAPTNFSISPLEYIGLGGAVYARVNYASSTTYTIDAIGLVVRHIIAWLN